MTAYYLCSGSLVAKLAEFAGIPVTLTNVLVGLPTTLMVVELLGGWAAGRARSGSRFLRAWSLVWRLLLPCVFLLALLPRGASAAVFLGFAAMCVAFHFSMPAYNAWTVACTQGRVAASFYSLRDLIFIAVYLVITAGFGLTVAAAEQGGWMALSFALVAAGALALTLSSLWLLRRAPAPPALAQPPRLRLSEALRAPLSDKAYRRILLINVVWNFSSMFLGNFAATYQVRVLPLSFFSVILWTAAANLARILAIPLFARFAACFGWKATTQLSLGVMALYGVLWTLVTSENAAVLFPIATTLSGVPWAGLGIGIFKYQIAYTRPAARASYFAMTSAAGGLAALAGSALCSAMLGAFETLFAAPPYWVIFAVGVAGALLTAVLVGCTPYREASE